LVSSRLLYKYLRLNEGHSTIARLRLFNAITGKYLLREESAILRLMPYEKDVPTVPSHGNARPGRLLISLSHWRKDLRCPHGIS
jgi:hypothetical protein